MAIQNRRGDFKDFDPYKMVPGEFAIITSGDPNSKDGTSVYHCFAPGVVKRLTSYEDLKEQVDSSVGEIIDERIEEALKDLDISGGGATEEQIEQIEKNKQNIENLQQAVDNIKIPAKTSELNNDSGFITSAVNDLANYYLKNQTYSRTEIDNKLSAIPKFSIEVVSTLPTSNISTTTVYLVSTDSETNNLYTEYIYVNNKWEYLGKQTVDLTGYVQKTELSSYYTKTEMESLLTTIRNSIPTKISQLADDSTHRTVTDTEKQTWNNKANTATTLAGYGITDGATKEQFNQVQKEIADLKNSENIERIYVSIPKTIHIVVGNEFKMYYKNVLSCYADRLWLSSVSGINVKRYKEYLSITATSAITKSINWKIYDDSFNVLDSGTIQVIATAETAKTTKVLVIGDSTVTQSNAISQKLLDCFSASGGNLTLLGTKGTAPALHEGRAGWTTTKYCTTASDNPFYNNGFDFSYYMTQQGYSGVDIVVIQLGINDIFSMTFENYSDKTTLNNIESMVESILSYDGNIKIIVNLISPPNGNGTAFTDSYNTSQIEFVYLTNTIRLSKALIDYYNENNYVTISPNNCVLDVTTDINDGVHPNLTGYAKLGQAIYETINGIEEAGGGSEEPDVKELWNAGSRTAKYNTYKPATTAGTFSNDYYYYPAAYTGALANTIEMSDVIVGSNSLQFKASQSAYGIFVPFVGLDSTKKYKFTVNPQVAGFRVYLVNYDSTGVYKNNALIVDKTTGETKYEFTPTEGYQQGFCFACLSATANTLGTFTGLSLTEVTT